jgi:hypothetical protein
MVTAISILLLSAVGGGLVGSLLTTNYPKEPICGDCDDKKSGYERDVGYYGDEYSSDDQYYSDEQYGY